MVSANRWANLKQIFLSTSEVVRLPSAKHLLVRFRYRKVPSMYGALASEAAKSELISCISPIKETIGFSQFMGDSVDGMLGPGLGSNRCPVRCGLVKPSAHSLNHCFSKYPLLQLILIDAIPAHITQRCIRSGPRLSLVQTMGRPISPIRWIYDGVAGGLHHCCLQHPSSTNIPQVSKETSMIRVKQKENVSQSTDVRHAFNTNYRGGSIAIPDLVERLSKPNWTHFKSNRKLTIESRTFKIKLDTLLWKREAFDVKLKKTLPKE